MQLPNINHRTLLNEVVDALRHPALAVRGQAVYEATMRLRTNKGAALRHALADFARDQRNWDGRVFHHLPLAAIALAEWSRVDAAGAAAVFVTLLFDERAAAQEYLSELGAWPSLRDALALAA